MKCSYCKNELMKLENPTNGKLVYKCPNGACPGYFPDVKCPQCSSRNFIVKPKTNDVVFFRCVSCNYDYIGIREDPFREEPLGKDIYPR